MRITEGFLLQQVYNLNRNIGIKDPEWNTIGSYQLSYENSCMALHKITNKSGAVDDVFRRGHMPKRELSELIFAYATGLFEGIKLCE